VVPGPEGTARGALSNPPGGSMFQRTSQHINGRHPSGADLCQQCGASATLVAHLGPDWVARRVRSYAVCSECAPGEIAAAERFGRDLTLTALSR
jgi:hypothetical protein